MDVGVSPAKSILQKPLKLLTEEDISQLTREDCRNFLKEKGMHRPSWNKSQAIQQVITLKSLFEPGDDSGTLRKILVSQPANPSFPVTIDPTTNEFGACGSIPFQEDDGRRDSPRSAEFSGGSGHYVADMTVSPSFHKEDLRRSQAETSPLVDQMTIFYSGKVIVYDGVSSEKARSIMHFAASPIDLPESRVFASSSMISKPMSKDVECQANRKVSLQRYRKKQKDRRFSKAKKAPGITSSSLEMFRNLQPRMNDADSQNLRESPENQRKSPNLSVDLNS